MLNIEFQPIVSDRNYAPTRTFVTKWDVEIDNNRAKKISRRRDRDTKYFDHFDQEFHLPPVHLAGHIDFATCRRLKSICDEVNAQKVLEIWEVESDHDNDSDDGEGEETRQAWLRSVHAENDYFDRKYASDWYDMNPAEVDTDQRAIRKRVLFSDEESDFKRVRA